MRLVETEYLESLLKAFAASRTPAVTQPLRSIAECGLFSGAEQRSGTAAISFRRGLDI